MTAPGALGPVAALESLPMATTPEGLRMTTTLEVKITIGTKPPTTTELPPNHLLSVREALVTDSLEEGSLRYLLPQALLLVHSPAGLLTHTEIGSQPKLHL